jgi:transcriptional regulator with XRE-family HTH domain
MMKEANKRLVQVREYLGLRQYEMANALHMQPSSYNSIESGKNNVSPRVQLLLNLLYNINTEWLMHGNGEMIVPKKEKAEAKDRLMAAVDDPSEDNTRDALVARITELEAEVERYKRIVDALTKK